MFKATYIVFLIMHILYNKTTSCIESFYGVKTNEYPKTSCHKIANIEIAGRCLGTCGTRVDRMVMISLDKSTKTCMCCSDITGSDITGPNWKSYVPRTCEYFFYLSSSYCKVSWNEISIDLTVFHKLVCNRRKKMILMIKHVYPSITEHTTQKL